MRIGFTSTRLAGTDGVSLETAKWTEVVRRLGHEVYYCAGELGADAPSGLLVPEMHFAHQDVRWIQNSAFGSRDANQHLRSRIASLTAKLKTQLMAFVSDYQIDLIIPENIFAIPMQIPLAEAWREVLLDTGLPAIAHNHDFYWERERFQINSVPDILKSTFPPDLPNLRHVVINSLAQADLKKRRGIESVVIPNVFDFPDPADSTDDTPARGIDDYNADLRQAIGLSAGDILILQPTRVVRRKGIELSIDLCGRLNTMFANAEQVMDAARAVLVITHRAGDEGLEYLHRLQRQAAAAGVRVVTYDWGRVVAQSDREKGIWTDALGDCGVAVCTVHPPRDRFHCSVFAARCIRDGGLKTHLVPKTGTIVPAYRREFYLPDEGISSTVIAITEFTRQYLIRNYRLPPERVSLIYQGTDTRRFRPTAEGKAVALNRYPLPGDAFPILGCIGSFEQRKGQPVLLNALARLAARPLPAIHLLLVGDGPDEEMLRAKVKRMGLERHVSFFPFTDQPQHVYQRVDITVLPSLSKEGLPNVLLESMATSVPVISSNLGGVPEVVVENKTGYLVEPGDSDQSADAIHRLGGDQAVGRQMGEHGRVLVEKEFDKQVQFGRFLDCFATLRRHI